MKTSETIPPYFYNLKTLCRKHAQLVWDHNAAYSHSPVVWTLPLTHTRTLVWPEEEWGPPWDVATEHALLKQDGWLSWSPRSASVLSREQLLRKSLITVLPKGSTWVVEPVTTEIIQKVSQEAPHSTFVKEVSITNFINSKADFKDIYSTWLTNF